MNPEPRVVMHGTVANIPAPWSGRHVVIVAGAASTVDALVLARARCTCGYDFPNVISYRPGRIICHGTPR